MAWIVKKQLFHNERLVQVISDKYFLNKNKALSYIHSRKEPDKYWLEQFKIEDMENENDS